MNTYNFQIRGNIEASSLREVFEELKPFIEKYKANEISIMSLVIDQDLYDVDIIATGESKCKKK